MSVQPACPFEVPGRVQVTILGRSVVADVVETLPEADAGRGPWDRLVVEHEGNRYRVDAADAEAEP